MSEESQSNKPSRVRVLRPAERELIEKLLAGQVAKPGMEVPMQYALVEDMQDGGMGSIRFVAPGEPEQSFGDAIAEAEYIDEDGVLVSITINVDQNENLFEVDFWKVDFSPLRRYPKPVDVSIKERR